MGNAAQWRVWATRPELQNQRWSERLAARGFEVVKMPLLKIEPVDDAQGKREIRNLILDFDQFQKVIFVSQNAVNETFHWLADYWPQLPVGIRYFAIGKRTAQEVAQAGVEVVAGSEAMNSDELLSLPEMDQVWGEKILICRGRGGLPRLGEVLHSRGAIVRYCELYRRVLPDEAATIAQNFLSAEHTRDVFVLFSGESLQNLDMVLQTLQHPEREAPVLVPGKRVAQMAANLGFKTVLCAVNASEDSMLAKLDEWLDQQPQ